MKPKISIITLGVADLKRSLQFYRDGLELSTHNYKAEQGIVFFQMEGTWLALYPKDKLAEDITIAKEGNGFSGITLAHNVASKEDVDNVMEQAISAGATLLKKPQDVFWGGYSGYFSDFDGHLWEIAHNPFTDLT